METRKDNRATILIIDDEPSIVEVLRIGLQKTGFSTLAASDGAEAIGWLQQHRVDLVLLDLRLGRGISGFQVMQKIRELESDLPIIMITAYGTIETAVEAIKTGACDFVCKPFKIRELEVTIMNALKSYPRFSRETLEEKNQEDHIPTRHFGSLVGESEPMQKVYRLIEKSAPAEATVLIEGESGTGKELVARAIHDMSRRRQNRLISLNCAAIPDNLLESEMFGYVAGAFTGADFERRGLFLSAHKGTLFLDEIGIMNLNLQKKLLRALQEGKIRRLGENTDLTVDVRVVAATNETLAEKVRQGSFREDLYYRINVIPIQLPALRERRNDLPILADYFLRLQSRILNRQLEFAEDIIPTLRSYPWPGNIRELENAIACASTLSCEGVIKVEDLPPRIANTPPKRMNNNSMMNVNEPDVFQTSLRSFLKVKEQEYIDIVLQKVGGNRGRAADILGISRATFYRKYDNPIQQ